MAGAPPAPVQVLQDAPGCVTDVEVAPDGSVYLLDFLAGAVSRISR